MRAEFTGHSSVLFFIAHILVTLSGTMFCCSLVLCEPQCGVIMNPYNVYLSCCCILLVATNCQKAVICEITDYCCVAFCAVTTPHIASSTASHPQLCVCRSK